MAIEERKVLQSQIYRELFELAQREGIEVVTKFVSEYRELLDVDYLTKAVLQGKHDTLSFAKRHKAMIEFLKRFNLEKKASFMTDREFLKMMARVDEGDLSKYIETAGFLEELGIEQVSLMEKNSGIYSDYRTTVWYNRDNEVSEIDKQYTNGSINYYGIGKIGSCNYDVFRTSISFLGTRGSKYILSMENRKNGKYSCILVSDFDFDTSSFPSREEIWSLNVPKTLEKSKEYVKR